MVMSEWQPLWPSSSNQSLPPVPKVKEVYWKAKHVVMKKLGIKEDEYLIASDAQLDAKLELFRTMQKSCTDLLLIICKYQQALSALSHEHNSMGQMLKDESFTDKTRARNVLLAVGKTQMFAAKQLSHLRVPLNLLHQEVETFDQRAVTDCLLTVSRMEEARVEYHAALLWMKDISQNLDPESTQQLDNFRSVQVQVRKTKERFDGLTVDTMQKVDLLCAARVNVFNNTLLKYLKTHLHVWEKLARWLTAVAECFRNYQYCEWSMKESASDDISQQLTDELASLQLLDTDTANSGGDGTLPTVPPIPKAAGTLLYTKLQTAMKQRHKKNRPVLSGGNLPQNLAPTTPISTHDEHLADSNSDMKSTVTSQSFIDFTECSNLSQRHSGGNEVPTTRAEMEAFDEIFGSLVNSSSEWHSLFTNNSSPVDSPVAAHQHYLPSLLLDCNTSPPGDGVTTQDQRTIIAKLFDPLVASQSTASKQTTTPDDKMSWYKLFAQLDPVSNPDTVGRTQSQQPVSISL